MHVIRLRKPWTKTPGHDGSVCRVDVPEPSDTEPSDAEPEAKELVAHYGRRFNCPSRLKDASVHLRITGWRGRLTSLMINETPIPVSESSTSINVEVTPLLQTHNQLLVTLTGTPGTPPCLSGEVTLGIQERPTT